MGAKRKRLADSGMSAFCNRVLGPAIRSCDARRQLSHSVEFEISRYTPDRRACRRTAMGPTSPRKSWSFDGQRIGLPKMDVSPRYLELICGLLGVAFAVSSVWYLRGDSQLHIRQAIVSCGLALIALGGLVPELASGFGFYDLVFVGFCISVAGIRIFIYGRRLQLGHDQ